MSRGVLIGVVLRLLGRFLLAIGALHGALALGYGSLCLSLGGGPPGGLAPILQNIALFAVLGLVLLRQWRWLARKLAGRPGQVCFTESRLRWATAGALGTLALHAVGIREARWVADAIHGAALVSGELGAVTVGASPGLGSTGASLLVVLVCASCVRPP